MTDHWSQWKANVALGMQLVVQRRLFSPTLTPPRLLCSLPSLQELTSPFLSLAAELSSHFHLSHSQQDGRMLGRADRGELTWLDKLVIVEPHHHRRRRRRRPALSAPYPILLCHSVIPFISSNLSSTPFLSSPPPSPCSCFPSLYHLWLGCRQRCGIGNSMGLEESSGTKQS